MYPTVVMLLVETQRSTTDIEIGPSNPSRLAGLVAHEAHPATSGSLPFAVRLVRRTTDREAESQLSHTFQSQGGQERDLEAVILEVKRMSG